MLIIFAYISLNIVILYCSMISQKYGEHFGHSRPEFGTKSEFIGQLPAFTPGFAAVIRRESTGSLLLYQEFP